MNIENLSTLKIHKLTQEQYERELAAGRIDENALYLTPDEGISVDDTLTIAGAAADAKAVGDAIDRSKVIVQDDEPTDAQDGALWLDTDAGGGNTEFMTLLSNHTSDKNNPHNVTIEQVGAAPVGLVSEDYYLNTLAELETVITNEFTAMPRLTVKILQLDLVQPTNEVVSAAWFATIFKKGEGTSFVRMDSFLGTVQRKLPFSESNAWEWENPPMHLGIEYRTTERRNGKVVYAKRISLGTVAAGENNIGINIQGVTGVCGLELTDEQNCNVTNHMNITSLWTTTIAIVIRAQWQQKLYATLKYIKD